jgi:recombination protein RecA
MLIDTMVGRKVDWIVDFNKIGPPMQKGDYNFYYNGHHVGIDRMSEVFNLGVQHGVIQKTGKAYYEIDGTQFHGKAKTIEAIRDNPGLLDEVVSKIG